MALPYSYEQEPSAPRPPRREGEYEVASSDIIKRALMSGELGPRLMGAIKSLTTKGINASRGIGPGGKYEPGSEFGNQHMNPNNPSDRSIVHQRYSKPGQLGELTWPTRDHGRFHEANSHLEAQQRKGFINRTHPGGGIASAGAGDNEDAGMMSRLPNLQHNIIDTPAAQIEPIKAGKQYTAKDPSGGLNYNLPARTGTKKQIEDYLIGQERMGVSDDWEGAVQQYEFPQGEVPQYLRGALDRMQGKEGWDQDAIRALSAMYPEIPMHEIRNMIQQGALSTIADSPRYKKEFDYKLFTPREGMMEDAIRIFNDKGKHRLR